MDIKIGTEGYTETTVTSENCAKAVGSGTLEVFATPAMIALMEKTAWTSVQPYLEKGQGTVGISMNITHNAPTPIGMKVSCKSVLTNADGRRLTFSLIAYDEKGEIGRGTHERFIIDCEKFQAKADAKRG